MSGNNLSSMGAHVLESCIHGVRCIASLDISDSSTYSYILRDSFIYQKSKGSHETFPSILTIVSVLIFKLISLIL